MANARISSFGGGKLSVSSLHSAAGTGGRMMECANDSTYDAILLFFSSEEPPRVRDAINPFTLLRWKQVGNELHVVVQIMDDDGAPTERSMKIAILPNNEHALQTLRSWLPSGGLLPLKVVGSSEKYLPGG